jgi:uncharacterized caspase-like protein
MGRQSLLGICLLSLVGLSCTSHAIAQEGLRIALVVGNAAYGKADTLPALKNPGNDAADMAATLKGKGFAVRLVVNADSRGMRDAITAFADDLGKAGAGAVALFYYAGHAVRVAGRDYLVPVGARVTSAKDLEFEAVSLQRVMEFVAETGAGANIVIVDSNRDNPFPSGSAAASEDVLPPKSFAAFATNAGGQASDGSGRNGLFTEHLLKSLGEPDLGILAMFMRVAARVSGATGGNQVPIFSSTLTSGFDFRAPVR